MSPVSLRKQAFIYSVTYKYIDQTQTETEIVFCP